MTYLSISCINGILGAETGAGTSLRLNLWEAAEPPLQFSFPTDRKEAKRAFLSGHKLQWAMLFLKLPCTVSLAFAKSFPAQLPPVFLLEIKTNKNNKNLHAKKRTIDESCAAAWLWVQQTLSNASCKNNHISLDQGIPGCWLYSLKNQQLMQGGEEYACVEQSFPWYTLSASSALFLF